MRPQWWNVSGRHTLTQAVHLWLTRKQALMSTYKWWWNKLLLCLHNVVNWTFIKKETTTTRSVVLNVLNEKKISWRWNVSRTWANKTSLNYFSFLAYLLFFFFLSWVPLKLLTSLWGCIWTKTGSDSSTLFFKWNVLSKLWRLLSILWWKTSTRRSSPYYRVRCRNTSGLSWQCRAIWRLSLNCNTRCLQVA